MVIGIEAERGNHPVKTGVEHYTKQLILGLAEQDKTNQYILYLRTKPEPWFFDLPKNFKVKILGYGPIPFPYLWTQIRLSLEMLFAAPDVLFIPAASLPLIHPKKSVVTVHDVAWRLYPETFKTLKRWYLEFTAWFACKFAWQVIAVSQATKDDLIKFYKTAEHNIRVVHHGYDAASLVPQPGSAELISKLPEQYILFLGTIQPRKNIVGLIDAFLQLKHEQSDLPHKLVLAGAMGWKIEETSARMNYPDIIYLGHVADNDRWHLLHNASVYVLPSFYEGFGMPILEAFAAQTPVTTSNISSLPEVALDAAVYFDPHNIRDIKQAIQSVLFDQKLRSDLVTKGTKRLADFSWSASASQTLSVLTHE